MTYTINISSPLCLPPAQPYEETPVFLFSVSSSHTDPWDPNLFQLEHALSAQNLCWGLSGSCTLAVTSLCFVVQQPLTQFSCTTLGICHPQDTLFPFV